MSQFDIKMTELADAIKSKNNSAAGKLSVQGMIDAVVNITLGDSTGGVVKYGYWTADGKFQEVDLSGDTPVDKGEPITVDAVMFDTGKESPEYGGGSGGADLTIYRCTEYDSGEAIPAYSNITVSGITSDSVANGAMTLLDRTTSGGNRLWGKDSYRLGYDSFNEHWCFYDSSNVYMPWADSAMFKAKCLYTTNEGTNANKMNWHDVTVDGDSCRTEMLNTSTRQPETSNYNYFFWFILKLKAGVTYTIGMVKDAGTIQNHHVYLYNEAGTEKSMYSSDVEVNGVTLERGDTYTPSADEIVFIKAGNASYPQYNGTFQLYCYPAPEVVDYVNKEPWQCTWEPVTGTGSITMATQEVAERPATGVQVWSGFTGTQDETTKEWSFSNEVKSNMSVSGVTPKVGSVYTEDTSLQIAGTYNKPPADGKMVALFHMERNASVVVDATETCMLVGTNQCSPGNTEQVKFGTASFAYNYMDVNDWMSGAIVDLPELDAFTVEFWHYYAGYYDKFGGPLLIVQNPDGQYGDYGVTWLSGANFPKGSKFRSEKRWFHHALVREAGSQLVTEYIDGKPAAMYQFAPKLGGGRKVWVRAGGFEPGQSGDVRNYMDELAVFNYAKYHGEFTPPTEPYPDIISGLGRPKGSPREVTVSGITGIPFANDPGYALKNASSTGTSRQWDTEDGQWYMCFDWDSNYCWVIANKTSAWDDGYVCAARLVTSDDEDQSTNDFDPIGHDGWTDNITNKKISVTAN